MKKQFKLFIAITSIAALAACGGEAVESVDSLIEAKDLAKMQERRGSISQEIAALKEDMAKLDVVISELDTNKKLPLVSVREIKEENFKHYVEVQGDVMTDQALVIYPEVPGILKKVFVKMGDQVKEGQLLAAIDDSGIREQLEALEYQAELAKTTYERQERLWKKDIGSELQYLNAKTNYQSAQKAAEQARAQLEKTQLMAPYSGIVDDVLADKGQLLAPGQSPVIRLVNLQEMYVSADVPESYLATVAKGKETKIVLPVLDTTIVAEVSKMSNYINPNNRTFRVEVNIPKNNGMIKPNLMAKLEINDYSNEKALLIPLSLISENSTGQQYVYIAAQEGNKTVVHKTIIETGFQQGDYIEVLSGLKNNDQIIEEGARVVKDGQEVKIIQ